MLTINNTIDGAIQDIEINGNTVQNPDNLADIKSVGELQEDGTYKMSILSCGKNLFNPLNKNIEYSIGGSQNKVTYKVEGDKIIIKSNPSVSSDWGWVEFKNIEVTPNKSYTIHPNATVIKGNVCVFVFDSNNTKLFEIPNTSKTFIPTTKHISIRLYVQTTTLYTDAEIHYKPYLTEGTVATEYEPYQGNKCDILLPCQLEKVGDVSDRLYYDDVEKDWCIEKNIGEVVLNGSEKWRFHSTKTNTSFFQLSVSSDIYKLPINNNIKANILSSSFINEVPNKGYNKYDMECIYLDTERNLSIRIFNSKLNSLDLEGFLEYLKQNPTLVKYQLATPQKIILPLSTQIALNSFFGTTHVYMESGEVEGTIKCKIPKSLGATVQSLNNKTDILSERIEAIEGLKDSQNMKYETDKGYLVCKETKNGVIDDLKIEGKTLVNRTDIFNKVNPTGGGAHRKTSNSLIVDYNKCGELDNSYSLDEINVFKSGQIYTIIIDIIQNTLNQKVEFYPMIWDFATIISGNQFVNTGEVGRKIFVIKSNKDYALKLAYASPGQATQGVTGLVEFKDIMVLDGDYTNIELPNYFEGLMSVGEDVDKIEVLSCNNGNLVNSNMFSEKGLMWAYGTEYTVAGRWITDFIEVSPRITLERDNKCILFLYDKNKNYLGNEVVGYKSNSVANENNYKIESDVKYIRVQIDNTSYKTMYLGLNKINKEIDYKQDKKQILFYNENGELEPIQELHEWDSIEKHSDNKWYYHKRSGKVVLNGSENWLLKQVNTNCTVFALRETQLQNKIKLSPQGVSDKFAWESVLGLSTEVECIGGHSVDVNTIRIAVAKSKLSTQDVQGFKQWLQANNVTVVYQLAEEEVYEIAPLHLDSYANETLILCNSGAISPKMEFSITSHINELVKAYGERINLLEEKVYKYMVTQNRMQLASTYSADSVTFKVDYFSLCGDEENYDEDLYNLILNNILVGKDNYDYDKMFTMILDYASWNQISWEQFDILVGLMDIQHNPPVEELPTEDGIEEDIIENEETPVE